MINSPDDKSNLDNKNDPRRRVGPPGGNGPGKYPRNFYSWVFLLMLGLMVFMLMTNYGGPQPEKIILSEFLQRLANKEVLDVVISDSTVKGTMKPEAMVGKDPKSSNKFKTTITPEMPNQDWFKNLLNESGATWDIEQPSGFVQLLSYILPWVLIITVFYFFIFRQFRGAGGAGILGSFGRSKHRVHNKEQSRVTFEQVAGIDEAKEEVSEIITFLKSPKKFQRLGGRIPRGVLLIGEPGCGKTLLAKAIAGEADVPFFSISGSDFVEMFVGVGASRVRDLFKQAKDSAPCIIFLDEIDAIGRKRGTSVAGGGHDEREQTLNAILVEMDGFSTSDQVIVIAATNRADVLDHALTRPGRFDRQIYVPLPDIKGRYEILKVHARKVKLGPDVDFQRLARVTPMFSGADLEAIINEAALAATMLNKDYIEMTDLEESRDKVRWGRARRSRVIDEKEKIATAYHEAGHALVQSLLEHADPVHKVSIIPRSNMGGATFSLPEKDRTMYTRQYCLALVRVCFGGRVAEELFCGDISSGAQSDIQQATEVARKMVMDWGMSDRLGFVHYGGETEHPWYGEMSLGREYSDRTADTIDQEIKAIMDGAYQDVKQILQSRRDPLEAIKQALLKYETLDGDEVKQLISGKPLDRPTVADLLELEQKKNAASSGSAVPHASDNAFPGAVDSFGGPVPRPEMG
jgi:cell division protease FtsH